MFTASVFSPHSASAAPLSHLFVVVLWLMVGILALVTGLVLYIAWRYRYQPGDGEPRQNPGNRKLEITWTVAPLLLLVGMFVFMLSNLNDIDPPTPQRAPDLVVIGHQWWWEIRYPGAGIVTANEIHLPVGTPMLTRLESADVIHDFWIPELARKMDMTPGHPTHMWLSASTANTYLGACSEYCGAQHAWMRLRVIAQPRAEFEAWQRQQQQAASTPTLGDAAQGALLFRQQTCVSCHAIAGTAANARIGPDLTHLASRQMLAAERLKNTPDNLAAWLANPQKVKPGSHMPDLQLTQEQVRVLVAYLETLQ